MILFCEENDVFKFIGEKVWDSGFGEIGENKENFKLTELNYAVECFRRNSARNY